MMGRMLKHVDCFLSPSRFTLQKHLEMGLDIPIKHMPYFLPTPNDSKGRSPQTDANRRPFFLFVGRLEYIKGVHNIIPSFQNQDKFDLVIAGDGAYTNELKKLADGDPRITFVGRRSQDELAALYESAVAVIVPSICYETFGIIVIEAFSRKTPVIVNDLGALPEVVTDSGGGYVYRGRDQLESYMNKLAADPDLRESMGMKGYVTYMREWNEEAHLEKYLGVVKELMDKANRKVPVENPRDAVAVGAP
jgi:glycosyltransferase involved in cell wall biosynthesis